MTEKDYKILLVDDDPSVLELLGEYIGIFGYNYDMADNGLHAVEKLDQAEYSIVLTDMMMPQMDGMELLKHIQKHSPQTKVIVITGYDRTFTYTDVIKAGASDFISKPFDVDELEAKLKRIIREIELLKQLEHLSISDGLTGLYNRRHFDTKILEEARRAARQKHDLYLAILDVDNLKEYNDQYGHQEGDKVLQNVGVVLRQFIREDVDWPFRYGGDEFCAILTQLSEEQAAMTAQRIIEKFAEKKQPLTGLSIGLAKFIHKRDGDWSADIRDLVKRADQALYKAKNAGRNQVVWDG